MILINLLPHREAARKRRKEAFFTSLGLAALLGGVICGFIYVAYQTQISAQNEKNKFLQAEIKKLENEIKEVSTLQSEIASLRARQEAVESLQADRNMPVYLLTELVKQMPDGVYVTSMKQDNVTLSLLGTAQSQERVSEFLRNLANNSQWFTKPELIEIVAASVALSPRDQRRVSNFSIRVQVRKPAEVQKPAAGASAASAPKKA
ncbi:MAG: fimbrial protein [Burkholderiales bacterium]|nr:MAG: fimbrial protein [Burkholderiales bacterium]